MIAVFHQISDTVYRCFKLGKYSSAFPQTIVFPVQAFQNRYRRYVHTERGQIPILKPKGTLTAEKEQDKTINTDCLPNSRESDDIVCKVHKIAEYLSFASRVWWKIIVFFISDLMKVILYCLTVFRKPRNPMMVEIEKGCN